MKKSGYFKLGLFVIAAFTVAVLGLISLGVTEMFQKSQYMETYLEESVQGLEIGSPVKYRGVKVGSVHEIDFVRNQYALDQKPGGTKFSRFLIIRMNLPEGFGMIDHSDFRKSLQRLVNQGLRIRLAAQGLTGQAYLEIDFLEPKNFAALEIPWDPIDPYLPSAPSKISQISTAIEKFVSKVDKAGVAEIAHNLDRLLVASTSAIEGAQVPRVRNDFLVMLKEVRQTNQLVQNVVKDPSFQRTPKELEKSLVNLNKTIRRMNYILASNQEGISETVENFKHASRDLKEVTENAKRYPSYIFFGEAPRKSAKK